MKKLLFLGALFLMLSSPVLADNACINDTYTNFSTTITVSGNSIPINYEEYCPFNCNNITGLCNPDPYDVNSIIFLILPIISFVLLYLTSLLKEEDWAIHLILLAAALMFILAPIGMLVNSLPNTPFYGLYIFLIVISIVVIFYYIIKLIVRTVEKMRSKR